MYRKKGKKVKKIKNGGCKKSLSVEKVEDENLKDPVEEPEQYEKEKKSTKDGSSLEDFKECTEEIKKIEESQKFQLEFINDWDMTEQDFFDEASKLTEEVLLQEKFELSPYTDHSKLSGKSAERAHVFWNHRLDYHPLICSHISDWARDLFCGRFQLLENYLKEKTIDQVISRVKHCESLLKVNSVFHVVLGATTSLNSLEQEIFDKLDPNEIDHLRCLRLLLNNGGSVNWRDGAGFTPLQWAVNSCSETTKVQDDIVKLLLDKGADPNAPDRTGSTPLMVAAQQGNLKYVQRFLSAGGDPTLCNNDGVSVMDCAKSYPEIISTLVISISRYFTEELDPVCSNDNCKRLHKMICTGCYWVQYCSKTCQKTHWSKHKRFCKAAPILFRTANLTFDSPYLMTRGIHEWKNTIEPYPPIFNPTQKRFRICVYFPKENQAEEDQHAVLFTLDYSIVAELKYTLNKELYIELLQQYERNPFIKLNCLWKNEPDKIYIRPM